MLHGRKEMGGGSQRSGSSPVGGVVAKPEYRTRPVALWQHRSRHTVSPHPFQPPQRGLPCLAIRDLAPLQPFGLGAIGGTATLAARRDPAPKAAPACRSTNSGSCSTSSTYKAVEKHMKHLTVY